MVNLFRPCTGHSAEPSNRARSLSPGCRAVGVAGLVLVVRFLVPGAAAAAPHAPHDSVPDVEVEDASEGSTAVVEQSGSASGDDSLDLDLTLEAILALSDTFGGESVTGFAGVPSSVQSEAVLQDRIRVGVEASFFGSDRLIARLEAGNGVPLTAFPGSIGGANLLVTNEGRLNFDDSSLARNDHQVHLDLVQYRFPIGDKLRVHLFGNAARHYHYAATLNPLLEDLGGGNGALSRFGERNPLYSLGGDAAGVGLNILARDDVRIDLGFLAGDAGDPTESNGLFEGNRSFLAQLTYGAEKRPRVAATYVRVDSGPNQFRFGGPGTAQGTFAANLLAFSHPGLLVASSTADSFGLEATVPFSERFRVSGWLGLTSAELEGLGDADIRTYALALTASDIGGEGNMAALIVGAEPTLTALEIGGSEVDAPGFGDDALHVEALLRYRLHDALSVTPGIIWLPGINQNLDNDGLLIATLRMTLDI